MDANIVNPCDIVGCKDEGLYKNYTTYTIEFLNGSKRNWVFQCRDHFFGNIDEPWFSPAGFERGTENPFIIEPVKPWPDPPKIKNEYDNSKNE